MAEKKQIVLVDGSSYLYRAFHGLPPLINSAGQATGAVYGVINMLRRLMLDYKPKNMAVIFDAKGKTFRDDIYPQYKANRPPMPDELRSQIEPLHKVVRYMGIPLLCIEGVEADDVIGTLAKQATEKKYNVIISTGDKDLAQLVNSHVTLINTMTNKKMNPDGVVEKFGIPPEMIIDYLGLVGDSSDNIPGVAKVGPKTAVKLLLEYGSIDQILKHKDEIKGKVGENIRNSIEQLFLSRKLATIKTDVTLEMNINQLEMRPRDNENLAEMFKAMEFKRWLREVEGDREPTKNEANYQTVLTETALNEWIERIKKEKQVAFDTETTSLDHITAEIVGISLALKPHEACYIPVAHDYEDAEKQLDRKKVIALLKPLLEDKQIQKIGQNLKYDAQVLLNYDITLEGLDYDTMLESYVYNSVGSRHDLNTLALKYLNKSTIKYEDVAGKGVKQIGFNEVEIEKATQYAAEDADIALQLHLHFTDQFKAYDHLKTVLTEIEIPLVPSLINMERAGVLINKAALEKQSHTLEKRIAEIEKETFALAGCEFNLNSPMQLQEILYEKLELPVLKKTPKGQPSTAEPVLKELALDYPLPKLLIEHRQLSKLKSTYTDQLPQQISEKTGRIHASFHQAVTATGRLSSSNPNLQNIPIRTEEGRKIRKAFIAEKGHQLIAADYSQIELRIMAHLSQDKGLLDAFEHGRDIHRATAAEIFGVKEEKVSDDQRRSAKAINFGLIYGMSAFGLAKQLGIERHAAQNYIELYFDRYPGVKQYMDQTRKKAREQGYVETLFHRRLYLPLINVRNKMQQQAAERTAINAPMQGSAADIIKIAMIKIHEWIEKENIEIKMIMQVHDELVFEVREELVEQFTPIIKEKMENATKLDVPLVVDVGVGNNWDEAH